MVMGALQLWVRLDRLSLVSSLFVTLPRNFLERMRSLDTSLRYATRLTLALEENYPSGHQVGWSIRHCPNRNADTQLLFVQSCSVPFPQEISGRHNIPRAKKNLSFCSSTYLRRQDWYKNSSFQ